MTPKKVVFAVILAGSPLSTQEKSDAIVMNNGDKITCEVKGLSSNHLYISVDYILSTQSLDWTKVDHIDSTQLFLIRTQDGTVYRGMLSMPKRPAEPPAQIEVVQSADNKTVLERTKVVNIDETSTNLGQRLNGQVGLGFTDSTGNESSQYNLNSSIGSVEGRWSAGANYEPNLSSSTGSNIATRNQISLQALRLVRWKNWYVTGLTNLLQSSVQGIQLQDTFGGDGQCQFASGSLRARTSSVQFEHVLLRQTLGQAQLEF